MQRSGTVWRGSHGEPLVLRNLIFMDQSCRDMGLKQQALYCYRKAYSLDPTNVDALWDRASLAVEMGELKTACLTSLSLVSLDSLLVQARNAYLGILKQIPHDLAVLTSLRPILIELSDLQTCTTLFQQAFDHYQALYPPGSLVDTSTSPPTEVLGGGFTLLEILVLADLYNTQGEHEKAISSIRRGCRWLQGRADQRYWDLCQDDREFDGEDIPPGMRIVVGEGVASVEQGHYFLDINARHRLAVARIKTGDVDEGKVSALGHFLYEIQLIACLDGSFTPTWSCRKMYWTMHPSSARLRMRILIAKCMRRLNRSTKYSARTLWYISFVPSPLIAFDFVFSWLRQVAYTFCCKQLHVCA